MHKLLNFKSIIGVILFAFISLTSNQLLAQDKVLSGTILGEDSSPLPGVNVQIKGTTTGTVTDFNGKFSLSVDEAAKTLVFSFIGYLDKEMAIGTQSVFDITLDVDAEQLEEVIVIGYGVQKKSVVTGAIASVKQEDITQSPVMNATESLQGRTAGVVVTSVSGQPGAGIDVKVRGTGSNGSNTPLFVVDGIQLDDISYLNPNDIQSMEVLKDAASAAIYGSRGANGVVIVTTKKGKAGKLSVSYDGYYGVQNAWRNAPVMNAQEYMRFHNEGAKNAGNQAMYTEDEINNPANNTNWQNEIFQSAPIQSHTFSLSGGSDKSTFMASMGYFGQDGIVGGDKSSFERISLRFNGNHKISKSFTFGNNFTIVRENKQGITEQDQHSGVLTEAILHDPLTPVYAPESEYKNYGSLDPAALQNSNGQFYAISDKQLQGIANPLAEMEYTNKDDYNNKVIGNVFLEFQPKWVKGLRFKTDLGLDIGNWSNRDYSPSASLNRSDRQYKSSSVTQRKGDYLTWQWENTLSYNTKIGEDHNISGLLGMTSRRHTSEEVGGVGANLQIAGFDYAYLNNTVSEGQQSDGKAYEHALLSYFGRASYDYKSKYMLSVIVRYDGSSNFGPNNKFGVFPSVQAGWVMSEDLFQTSDIVSFMRLRGSWGKVGNEDIESFGYLATIGGTDNYIVDGVAVPGYGAKRMANPDLKWEAASEINFGFDVGLLNNKINLNVDMYDRRRQDLLGDLPIPSILGVGRPLANIGTVQNKGIEMSLNFRDQEGDFRYDITGIASYNQNEVLEILGGEERINGESADFYNGNLAMQEGHSLPFFYGFKTDGILQNENEATAYNEAFGGSAVPGDIRFVDSNGDGVLDDNDRTDIGNGVHNWTLGLNMRFEYKNFDLSIFFQGQQGAKLFNAAAVRNDALSTGTHNYPKRFLNYWNGEGSTNSFPRWSHNDTQNNYGKINDMVHLEDGSYVRLKNMQIGYNLPTSALEKIGLSRARFYVSGNNLFTWTDYTGFDPEVAHGGTMGIGIDKGSYPQARSFIFGTNLTF